MSTDLGAAGSVSCMAGGDGARLQTAHAFGCQSPTGDWIAYGGGVTNVPGHGDPIQKVKDAFTCIGRVGSSGCGFEMPLEAAYRALSPALNINRGFLREGALLVVVFITDEDDCSVKNPQFFSVKELLKFKTCNYCHLQCFQRGVRCKETGLSLGPRTSCAPEPTGAWLYRVDRYIDFFKKLKKTAAGKPNPQRVIMAAIAGPTSPVAMGKRNGGLTVMPSCKTQHGAATPAIRLGAVVHQFARPLSKAEVAAGVPSFVDGHGVKREQNIHSICASDFRPALERLGSSIKASLGPVCVNRPLLSSRGGLVCHKGDRVGLDYSDQPVTCAVGCLELADLEVTEDGATPVRKCPVALFPPTVDPGACGAHCPCWRLIPRAQCISSGTPYAVEIMRKTERHHTNLRVCSTTSAFAWGTPEVARLAQCF